MKKVIAMFLLALSTLLLADNVFLRDLKLTVDPPTALERVVVNTSFTPAQTVKYDRIVFSCTLRQTISVPGDDGQTAERHHEPVKFEYVRRNVNAVKDLRSHIHFPVPVGLTELRQKYGRTTFPMEGEVTIPKVVITAFAEGGQVWRFELEPEPSRKRARSSLSDMMR